MSNQALRAHVGLWSTGRGFNPLNFLGIIRALHPWWTTHITHTRNKTRPQWKTLEAFSFFSPPKSIELLRWEREWARPSWVDAAYGWRHAAPTDLVPQRPHASSGQRTRWRCAGCDRRVEHRWCNPKRPRCSRQLGCAQKRCIGLCRVEMAWGWCKQHLYSRRHSHDASSHQARLFLPDSGDYDWSWHAQGVRHHHLDR
jgi:hypothetical protein